MKLYLPFTPKQLFVLIIFIATYSQPIQAQGNHHLDISISIFDMNLPENELIQKQLNIYPQIRSAEARYMPALLRATLENSDKWGAVRIIPSISNNAELMISGKIIHSDGNQLELEIIARDSAGQEWINQTYTQQALESISLNSPELTLDPFQALYNQVQTDLSIYLSQLSTEELLKLKTLASLRYGESLSPETYSPYLQTSPEGFFSYTSLPADNDPIWVRVEDIRQHEYLFIDVVDQQYRNFLSSIKPIYDLWRNYSRGLEQNDLDYQERQANESRFNRGSYRALKNSYDNFRWNKMQDQYLDQLSEGFNNEFLPSKIEIEDSVYELNGTLESQYEEWRDILRSLFELENE